MEKFTPQILRFDSLPSTNIEAARRAAEGAADGLCVVAGEQTAGRGRLQRQWFSPKDAGLYFSVVLRPKFEQRIWPLLTLMAAIAVRDALLEACALETDIKWPNDILVNEKKLCGILAETVETTSGRAVIVGIGINVKRNSFPVDLEGVATSIETETEKTVESAELLEPLLNSFSKHYETLQLAGGDENIVREVCARSSYANSKRVRVDDGEGELVGMTRGLESDGSLRVETDGGEIRTIRTGDVTLVRAS
ncbi:MAG: biotin--[acetyl-CoA-carboxylase] ligase [bacterium]